MLKKTHLKKNAWAEIGKLFDPSKPKEETEQKQETKAIRRKHGKNSKI